MSHKTITGYTTGTFDVIHKGHIALLKHMRQRCDVVVVGITTDALASTQKRTTLVPWSDRKVVVENLRQVDVVVAHDGESKDMAHRKIQFDLLFIGDDYINSSEYLDFSNTPVVYHPRTPNVSSVSLTSRNFINMARNLHTDGQNEVGGFIGGMRCRVLTLSQVEIGNTRNVRYAEPGVEIANHNRDALLMVSFCPFYITHFCIPNTNPTVENAASLVIIYKCTPQNKPVSQQHMQDAITMAREHGIYFEKLSPAQCSVGVDGEVYITNFAGAISDMCQLDEVEKKYLLCKKKTCTPQLSSKETTNTQ